MKILLPNSILSKSLQQVPDETVVRKLPMLDVLGKSLEEADGNRFPKIPIMVKYRGVPDELLLETISLDLVIERSLKLRL